MTVAMIVTVLTPAATVVLVDDAECVLIELNMNVEISVDAATIGTNRFEPTAHAEAKRWPSGSAINVVEATPRLQTREPSAPQLQQYQKPSV